MSEPMTIDRNIERLAGLWPSAGFTHDWMALFRKEFRNANQHWLAEAMESVKRSKASHVPELKWFIEEFREVGRRFSAVARDEPQTLEDRARARAQALERERLEVEAERVEIRRQMASLDGSAIDRIRETMRANRMLSPLATAIAGPVDAWPPFACGMAHAIAVRDGLIGVGR